MESHGKYLFRFLRYCQTGFQSGRTFLHSRECSAMFSPTLLQTLGLVSILNFGHSGGYTVVSHDLI